MSGNSGRCPISIASMTDIDLNWPDILSKTAVVDPQDLHLIGTRLRLTDDSRFVITPSILLIMDCVSKILVHWWHWKIVKYLSLHKSSVRKYLMMLPSDPKKS
ncbi:hypothetical protein LOD99_5347 [Oopsacas minuta]|uniref:Uncharacterized protein n=1 Tax=Oopsacas minuta TaxID=111878 RepID=A0AAV7JS56_9METZ|nr:hypothetical protein LOD99_5347 [Oopsacas minuta]